MPRESNCLCNCTQGKGRAVGPKFYPSTCPQAAMDNSCPSFCPFFTPSHNHPPALIPLSTVAGGGGLWRSQRLGWLEAVWCQGVAGGGVGPGQRSSARNWGDRWRRRLGGGRRRPVDKMKREGSGGREKTRRGYESQGPSRDRFMRLCVSVFLPGSWKKNLLRRCIAGVLHLMRGHFRFSLKAGLKSAKI